METSVGNPGKKNNKKILIKQKARRAQPNGALMASKRDEMCLFLRNLSHSPCKYLSISGFTPIPNWPICLIAFWAPDETRLSKFC